MLAQRTLKSLTRAVGVGLHSGQRVELTLRPVDPDGALLAQAETDEEETLLDEELLARVTEAFPSAVEADADATTGEAPATPRGRGRPRLGVVAREVTLLPRHWAWLAEQPGGASVVLRRLVEAASRAGADEDRQRRHSERTYHFLQAIAGDLPGFEEAIRVLFAHDRAGLEAALHSWPRDVRDHALRLAFEDADG